MFPDLDPDLSCPTNCLPTSIPIFCFSLSAVCTCVCFCHFPRGVCMCSYEYVCTWICVLAFMSMWAHICVHAHVCTFRVWEDTTQRAYVQRGLKMLWPHRVPVYWLCLVDHIWESWPYPWELRESFASFSIHRNHCSDPLQGLAPPDLPPFSGF